jgi:putative oxidoreductase
MQGTNVVPSVARPADCGLTIGLWTAQTILALMFGMAGVMKTTQPIAELAQKLVWPGAVPPGLVRFIGASELLGALGLLLPSVTRIKPGLTPLAAAGLVTIMALASVFHLTRGELPAIAFNLALGSVAAFVAWGRYRKAPIAPRGS